MCRSNYSDAHAAMRVSTKANQIESDSCHLPFLELQDSVSMSVPVPLLPSAPSQKSLLAQKVHKELRFLLMQLN